jgi:protein-S-isoprenylcysteine O-methyltransferase Ste14
MYAYAAKRSGRDTVKGIMAMFKTIKKDWYFILASSLIFFLAVALSIWEFLVVQKANYSIINVIGLILFLIGLFIRLNGKKTLGKYYSRGLRTLKDHKIVKQGFYKYIRHPIYLASIVYGLGIPLFFSSLYGFLIMLLLIPLIFYRIKIEEEMLLEEFGGEYREYIKQTKKLIPYIY